MTGSLAILVLVILPAIVFWARSRQRGSFTIGLFVGAIFASGIQWPVPLRLALSMLAILLLFRSGRSLPMRAGALVHLAGVTGVLALLFIEFSLPSASAQEREWWARYLVLFPILLLLGLSLGWADRVLLKKAVIFFSLTNAAIAVVEFALRTRLISTVLVASPSEFGFRAGAGAEHPLVLACLLATSAPFVFELVRTRHARFVAITLLIAGCVCTGSGGVTVLLSIFVILYLSRVSTLLVRTVVMPAVGTFALMALLATSMFLNYNDPLIVAVGDSASDTYRLVLYAFSGRTLADAPFGWGIAGVPSGVYVIPSAYGPLDLARTIDSEFVLLITQIGWLGVVVSILLIWSAWFRTNSDANRWALYLAVTTGFFLALHAWAGLGAYLLVLLGIALRGSVRFSDHERAVIGVDEKARHP